MFITLPRDEARARLYAIGHRLVGEWGPGSERWVTATGYEYGLTPELDGRGDYEEEMIKLAEQLP